MKKLTLEHLCCYLPYGLKMIFPKSGRIIEIGGIRIHNDGDLNLYSTDKDNFYLSNFSFKPILLPLSDLTKPITHKGEAFDPIVELDRFHNFSMIHFNDIEKDPTRYPFTIVQKLFEWHFDVFELIPAGLAIDVNSLPENPYK